MCTPSGVLIDYSDWRTIQTSLCKLLTAMGAAKGYPPGSTSSAPADPPKLLDRVRDRIRRKGYSIRTEKSYAHWIRRFILFHGKLHARPVRAADSPYRRRRLFDSVIEALPQVGEIQLLKYPRQPFAGIAARGIAAARDD